VTGSAGTVRDVRADRLVAIVLLLQVHGRLTAPQLAEHLETSERTIRRDLDALCVAGVPLYSKRGRGGGWQLLGGHRIDLSGLTAGEAEALFVATAPGASGWLAPGAAQALGAARRKVLAALPEPLRDAVRSATSAVLVDPSSWRRGPAGPSEPPDGAHLSALRAAVLSGVQVVLRYEPPGRPAEDRRLHPYGLVCKQGTWYLVAGAPAGLRTYRLSRVRAVTVTGEQAERPDGFDLARAWAGVQEGFARRAVPDLAVDVAATPAGQRNLEAVVGAWWPVEEVGTGPDGRCRLRVRFPDPRRAALELMRWGDEVEVLAPDTVRAELAVAGHRLVVRYGSPAVRVQPDDDHGR
jgi:predicted DNA-binding transcriptional regulator YafY